MATIRLNTGNADWKGDANGVGFVGLYDASGNPIFKAQGDTYLPADGHMPIGGVNDGLYRPARVDRWGSLASGNFIPVHSLDVFTAVVPPTWLQTTATATITAATTTGVLLNAGASLTSGQGCNITPFNPIMKYNKAPILFRGRARLIKGNTNGQADIGLFTAQPAVATPANGFAFSYLADGTLKPVIYFSSAAVLTGANFAASIDSLRYYVWDILVDDDSIRFIVQDPTTNAIVTDQTLDIGSDASRLGQLPYLLPTFRVYNSAAVTGTATQMYVADCATGYLDIQAAKPWSHIMAQQGKGAIINPTVALAQLANWANSAAPASATLSNTAAGYTTLGGQFQFAAVAGAETDYALFGFTVPTGLKLNVTGIDIDTMNTGAAVATTATWLSWFADVDSPAITLAANSFRIPIGNQVFPIAAAIGAQATRLQAAFDAPLVTGSGRLFKVGLKMPLGTATASQVIRGTVTVKGYFD